MLQTQQWVRDVQVGPYQVLVKKGYNPDNDRYLLQLIAFDGQDESMLQYGFGSQETRDLMFLNSAYLKDRAEALLSLFEA